mmetsp:Transcript_7456/g.20749  ORF Transcript_7456/g.20749 Transcript_7456/m.20749 type:complete len:284 (-) Transcript_7456:2-853(-)
MRRMYALEPAYLRVESVRRQHPASFVLNWCPLFVMTWNHHQQVNPPLARVLALLPTPQPAIPLLVIKTTEVKTPTKTTLLTTTNKAEIVAACSSMPLFATSSLRIPTHFNLLLAPQLIGYTFDVVADANWYRHQNGVRGAIAIALTNAKRILVRSAGRDVLGNAARSAGTDAGASSNKQSRERVSLLRVFLLLIHLITEIPLEPSALASRLNLVSTHMILLGADQVQHLPLEGRQCKLPPLPLPAILMQTISKEIGIDRSLQHYSSKSVLRDTCRSIPARMVC